MEKIYNKLVRDNIPEIIINDNEIPITRTLSNEEYRIELYKKLLEECNEVLESKVSDDTIEELAELLEIIKSVSELENRNLEYVIDVANQKSVKMLKLVIQIKKKKILKTI